MQYIPELVYLRYENLNSMCYIIYMKRFIICKPTPWTISLHPNPTSALFPLFSHYWITHRLVGSFEVQYRKHGYQRSETFFKFRLLYFNELSSSVTVGKFSRAELALSLIITTPTNCTKTPQYLNLFFLRCKQRTCQKLLCSRDRAAARVAQKTSPANRCFGSYVAT